MLLRKDITGHLWSYNYLTNFHSLSYYEMQRYTFADSTHIRIHCRVILFAVCLSPAWLALMCQCGEGWTCRTFSQTINIVHDWLVFSAMYDFLRAAPLLRSIKVSTNKLWRNILLCFRPSELLSANLPPKWYTIVRMNIENWTWSFQLEVTCTAVNEKHRLSLCSSSMRSF